MSGLTRRAAEARYSILRFHVGSGKMSSLFMKSADDGITRVKLLLGEARA